MKPKGWLRTFLYMLIVGACLSLIVAILYLRSHEPVRFAVAARELMRDLSCTGFALLGTVPLAGILTLAFQFLEWKHLRAALKLAMANLSAWIRAKNAATIFPRLQCFLFEVLLHNNAYLHLPLGQDPSCLTPHGKIVYDRRDCTIYRFELISPQAPDMDIGIMRQLIQNYVNCELDNYGIAGLYPVFVSKTGARCFSVYIDRVTFNAERHCLDIDVIYVCTEDSARYVFHAAQRDTKKVEVEQEVFDDEL